MVGELWIRSAQVRVDLHLARVASAANIADEPTRNSKNSLMRYRQFEEPKVFRLGLQNGKSYGTDRTVHVMLGNVSSQS